MKENKEWENLFVDEGQSALKDCLEYESHMHISDRKGLE